MTAHGAGARTGAATGAATGPSSVVAALLVALAIAVFAWEAAEIRPQIDDAYISYRYAHNFVAGHGLVFNPGERVEGITNLGFTLGIAAGIAAGIEAPLASHGLAVASGFALLLLTFALARAGLAPERRWLAGLAPWIVLSSNAFAAWTLSGLETPMFAALATAAFLASRHERSGVAAAAAAAATLVRPEGVLVAAVVFAAPLARALPLVRTPKRLFAAQKLWLAPLAFGLFVLALTAFRLAYYGSPVPNTFYAKVGGIPMLRGVRYVGDFFLDGSVFLLPPLLFAVWQGRGARALVAFALAQSAYAILVGGDAFLHGRFLLPALPMLAAAAVSGIDSAWRTIPKLAGLQAGLLVACPLAAILWPPFGGDALFSGAGSASIRLAEPARRAAARHANFLSDDVVARQARFVRDANAKLVATVAIGRMGFFSGVPILDLLGLADAHIAQSENRRAKLGLLVPGHQRSDADYVFERRPDFIFMLRKDSRSRKTQLPAVLDLWDDPRLERDYDYVDDLHAYRRSAGVDSAASYGDANSVLNETPLFYRPTGEAGRWREFGTHKFDAELTPEQRTEIEQLEAIGYVSGSRDAPEASGSPLATEAPATGVVVHDAARSFAGFNLYTSGHAAEAILTDMEGRELHRWHYSFWDAWPDFPIEKNHASTEFWRRALLQPDGSLLAIHEGLGLLKLDAASNLLWALPNRAHHDLAALPGGELFVLTREAHLVPSIHPDKPIIEDLVERLDERGARLARFSLLAAFEGTEFAPLVEKVKGRHGDIFHTNSLAVIERDLQDPAFRAGNLILYMLGVGVTAVVDPATEKVVWARFGRPERSHDPKLLDTDTLLVFENKFADESSRIVEYAGATKKIVWSYEGTPEQPFYSETCGTVDRLPNGNTLVTETDAGRAFELTPEKEIVWEFSNPHRAGPGGRYIASLFELVRLPADFPLPFSDARQEADDLR